MPMFSLMKYYYFIIIDITSSLGKDPALKLVEKCGGWPILKNDGPFISKVEDMVSMLVDFVVER